MYKRFNEAVENFLNFLFEIILTPPTVTVY